MIPVEWTDAGVDEVTVHRAVESGHAVRQEGSDVKEGTEVLSAGVRIGPAEIAVLSAVGHRSVTVYPRPRVVVLGTGEELVEPGRPLNPGQIWDSNSFMLTAAAIEAGCEGYRYGFVGDDPDQVFEAIQDALVRADIVITSGGISMGAHDAVKEVLSRLGTVHFDKVAVQPGMPQGYGTVGENNIPIITLPGNPVSSYVSFYLFVLPALRKMSGLPQEQLPSVRARLLAPITSSPRGRRSYLRAVLDYDIEREEIAYTALPVAQQGRTSCLRWRRLTRSVVVPEQVTELPEGSVVETIQLPYR